MANLQKIKDLAERRKISIRELADRVGLKENQIHVMCRTNSTKIDTLEKIAQVLDVHISEFFDDLPRRSANIRIEGDNNQWNEEGAHHNTNACGESALLQERVKSLEALLAEKERLIQFLLSKQ